MAPRTSKSDDTAETKTGVIKTVARPGGLEAVYERDGDGVVRRTVRKAKPAENDAE